MALAQGTAPRGQGHPTGVQGSPRNVAAGQPASLGPQVKIQTLNFIVLLQLD